MHNLQTKLTKSSATGEDKLTELLNSMKSIPGARVNVAHDEETNDLIGIYYQDQRMADIFEKYPEVLLCDATYKLNDRRMPLFFMLVVDGAGETEVACFWLIKSESLVAIGAMLDAFKSHNNKWNEVKVVISKYKFKN